MLEEWLASNGLGRPKGGSGIGGGDSKRFSWFCWLNCEGRPGVPVVEAVVVVMVFPLKVELDLDACCCCCLALSFEDVAASSAVFCRLSCVALELALPMTLAPYWWCSVCGGGSIWWSPLPVKKQRQFCVGCWRQWQNGNMERLWQKEHMLLFSWNSSSKIIVCSNWIVAINRGSTDKKLLRISTYSGPRGTAFVARHAAPFLLLRFWW